MAKKVGGMGEIEIEVGWYKSEQKTKLYLPYLI